MKTDRSPSDADQPAGNLWTRFWFTPMPLTGLCMLRVLSGLLFSAWLLSFVGHQNAFFSLNGWLDAQGYQDVQRQTEGATAPVGWSIIYLAGDNASAFQAIYWGSVAVLVLFTLGVATRLTGVATWVIVVSFLANPASSYEADYLLGILAFYLAIAHVLIGQWNGDLTLIERVLGSRHDFLFAAWLFPRAEERPLSVGANFALRLLQIHFVIIMFTSALHHLQIAEWWSGVAFWFPLHPPFQTTLEGIQREIPRTRSILLYLSITQYLALAWQLAFPGFAWRRGAACRTLLLGGAGIYWLGVFFLFRLPLFGPFVMICCLSYLSAGEWAWIASRFGPRLGRAAKETVVPEPAKVVALAGTETNIKKQPAV